MLILNDFVARLILDLIAVWLMVRGIYFGVYKTRDLFFTLNQAFGRSISVAFSMGAAFGLFAVFGMLRFRTEDISIKDMTYLFLAISLGVFSAVAALPLLTMGAVMLGILGLTALLESNWLYRRESVRTVLYDRVDLIQEANPERVMEDLRLRTALPVHRYQVLRVDLLRDTVQLKVYYFE